MNVLPRLAVLLALLIVAACAPVVEPAGPAVTAPRAEPARAPDTLIMADGTALPLRSWLPEGKPRAVVIAVHGMNDYSHAFRGLGLQLAQSGIATFAYDQRGFGAGPHPGVWAGTPTLVDDLRQARAILGARYPATPIYILGESMGGAVAMVARTGPDPVPDDGTILVAPAVWGRANMNIFEKGALWLVAHTVPWFLLSASGLEITPCDNIEILRELARDPLVIKETRADAVWGVVNLMDQAYGDAKRMKGPVLMQYGKRDEIIPKEPSFEVMRRLHGDDARIAYYENGYHMLLRDLNGSKVIADIAAWIDNRQAALPSKADQVAQELLPASRSNP
jgi:alpha-beta hydrolase superfamily lysophospholipase